MDDKTPPKPQLDLKERLRLSSGKSRRAQAREEEEREAREARDAEEHQKAEKKKARVDQFKLEGAGGPVQTEWSQVVSIDEAELARLEAPPKKGRAARAIVIAIISLIVILACLAAGYYFGRAFFGRSLENSKIQEAARVEQKLFGSESTKKLWPAILEHKEKIDEIVRTLARTDVEPAFQLRKLQEFMRHCAKFLETNRPPVIRDLLPSRAYNPAPAIIATALDLLDRVNRVFAITQTFMLERDVLDAIGTGEESDEQPPPRLANLIFELDPRGEGEVKVPWNKGTFIRIPPDSQVTYTPPTAPDPDAPPDLRPTEGTFKLKVKVAGKAELVEVDTRTIVEIDAWPVVRWREGEYRMALLERVRAVLLELQTVVGELRWDSFRKKLRDQAAKEPYFTL